MERVVLDASVSLKWFFPQEKNSDVARKILRKIRIEKTEVFVPQIFFFEIVNVIKTKTGIASKSVLRAINKIFSLNFVTEKADLILLKKANFYAQKYDLSIYDASYIALAKINGLIFITADEKMARRLNLKFVKSLKDVRENLWRETL